MEGWDAGVSGSERCDNHTSLPNILRRKTRHLPSCSPLRRRFSPFSSCSSSESITLHRHTPAIKTKRYLNAFSFISVIVAAYLMFLIFLNNTVVLPHWGRALTLALLLLLIASPLFIAIKAHQHHLQTLQSPFKNPFNQGRSRDSAQGDNLCRCGGRSESRTSNEYVKLLAIVRGDAVRTRFRTSYSQQHQPNRRVPRLHGERKKHNGLPVEHMELSWAVRGGIRVRHFHAQEGVAEAVVHDNHTGNNGCRPCNDRVGVQGNLYVALLLVGVCFGSVVVDAASLVRYSGEAYGDYTTQIAVANPLGSYILSVRVIGYIYDREESLEVGSSSCNGAHCFRLSFFILAAVSLPGLWWHWRL
ncbi:UNVERIFIED_CONTAM: hypothetical protein Sangu_0561800 [Sesamum angustifolium]|uniref:Nodulin-like domain-containing protein n=1 Tax=Sesamum angustifolium TaxID=2727405 RepID=A0AAW2QA36_9LAMI